MYVLGIETSCDETSVAIVEDGIWLKGLSTASSATLHSRYGGVIPEIASRWHLESILPVCEEALSNADIDLFRIDKIAVTTEPGLIPSLLVGISFAQAISMAVDKPLVEVNHLIAHLYAPFIDNPNPPSFPFLGLVVSGGHTQLFLVKSWREEDIICLGSARDDAAGEALDKAAKMLGLGYPGGPIIEKLASKGEIKYQFSCYYGEDLDFSFSGLKTSLLYFLQKNHDAKVEDICASYQHIVMETLVKKTIDAARKYRISEVVVGGGVSANKYLRGLFREMAQDIRFYFSDICLCLDNAAIIAGLGFYV